MAGYHACGDPTLVVDRFEKGKKRAEIQEMHDNPPDISPGQAYFINQMRAENER